jgi:hypothetical protein
MITVSKFTASQEEDGRHPLDHHPEAHRAMELSILKGTPKLVP